VMGGCLMFVGEIATEEHCKFDPCGKFPSCCQNIPTPTDRRHYSLA
jgi:hypothetical protein